MRLSEQHPEADETSSTLDRMCFNAITALRQNAVSRANELANEPALRRAWALMMAENQRALEEEPSADVQAILNNPVIMAAEIPTDNSSHTELDAARNMLIERGWFASDYEDMTGSA